MQLVDNRLWRNANSANESRKRREQMLRVFGLRWYEQLCLFLNDDINQFTELAFGIVVL